jgi:ABC-type uncharacterized transport system substrate-binding protein
MVWRWGAFSFVIGLMALSPSVAAHPHAWIDLRSRVLLDGEGRVASLELAWLFDDYYTVLVAEELGLGGTPSKDYLDEIAERNLTNLREYDYFTAITFKGERQPIGDVTRYETEVHDGRLWMRFEVPLEQPIDPEEGEVTFSVYDPTYWIEILHLEAEPILFSGKGAESCLGEIIQPNPTIEQVSLAAALDQDETAGDGLGELFAEKVVVSCS